MKGYKVFNPDFTCRGFQYEVGKTYEEDVVPNVRKAGFHFCPKLIDCFSCYDFDPNNKVAEIEAIGDIDEGDNKCCTNKITIVKEIAWQEVLEIVNTGKGNSGLRNSGDHNSGDWNSGDWNSGDWNSGNWNSGLRNSGDWNKTSFSSGVFCTEQPKLIMFNKPTEITFAEWRNSRACRLLNRIDLRPTEFILPSNMTDEEKAAHPEWETTGGYLKKLDTSECCHDWWMNLSMEEKCVIQNMPNFDAEIFKEITGIQM